MLSIILFASSLFLIALFFAVKEREVYGGTETFLTRFFRRHSPTAEAFVLRTTARIMRRVLLWTATFRASYRRVLSIVVFRLRALVVAVAERMIRAVKGEKILSMRNIPPRTQYPDKEGKNEMDEVPQV